uniref:Beta-defensin-like domain-containing protein n=1 Tax=Podarcis muralis TaxID=64176 RepID=A0A670I9V8_PODMU
CTFDKPSNLCCCHFFKHLLFWTELLEQITTKKNCHTNGGVCFYAECPSNAKKIGTCSDSSNLCCKH